MPKCALPDHLKNAKHSDWIWPFSRIPRSFNAFGPRCPFKSKGWKPWPPTLVKGYNVTRWENTGATSILYFPDLEGQEIDATIYGVTLKGIEEGSGLKVKTRLTKKGDYSPSALQKRSARGYMVLDPFYRTEWRILKRYDDDREPLVLWYRIGYRPDHKDKYYNYGPTAGFHFE